MALKGTVANLDDVPESVRGLYTERDGEFHLDVEEGGETDDLAAIRDARKARRAAESALAQLKAQLGVTDAEKAVEALRRQFHELEAKDLLGPGKWEAAVERRAEEVAAEIGAREGALTAEAKHLREQVDAIEVENAIRSAAAKAGVLPAAMEDLVPAAQRVSKAKDGKFIAMNGDELVFSSSNPTEPVGMEEWIGERAKDRPHWFSTRGGHVPHPLAMNGRQAGTVTLTREQAKDTETYRAAKEQAAKAGGQVLIVE